MKNELITKQEIEKIAMDMFSGNIPEREMFTFEKLIESYDLIDESLFRKNYNSYIKQYSFSKSSGLSNIIDKIIDSEFKLENLNEEERRILHRNITGILRREKEIFFKTIHLDILKIKNVTIEKEDQDRKIEDYLDSESADYIDYYESKINFAPINLITKKHIIYNAFRHSIRTEIEDVVIQDKLKYKRVNELYKQLTDVGFMEQYWDSKLHQLTNEFENDIVEMHQSGLSLNKIQKTLTDKCLQSGIIPSTIERYSRGKNEEKKVIEIEPKIPLSAIKKIISENIKQITDGNIVTVELIE